MRFAVQKNLIISFQLFSNTFETLLKLFFVQFSRKNSILLFPAQKIGLSVLVNSTKKIRNRARVLRAKTFQFIFCTTKASFFSLQTQRREIPRKLFSREEKNTEFLESFPKTTFGKNIPSLYSILISTRQQVIRDKHKTVSEHIKYQRKCVWKFPHRKNLCFSSPDVLVPCQKGEQLKEKFILIWENWSNRLAELKVSLERQHTSTRRRRNTTIPISPSSLVDDDVIDGLGAAHYCFGARQAADA